MVIWALSAVLAAHWGEEGEERNSQLEHLEEEKDCTSSIDVQVTPDVQPGNVKSIYNGVADVDASEYGARHPGSAEECPGINNPQCLPDVDDGPNDKGKKSWCDLHVDITNSVLHS